MRRLYFLLPDKRTTLAVVSELAHNGIPHHHLHAIASITQDIDDLPAATPWQTTELAHGIELGVGFGGMAGLLGGLLAVTFPPAGLVLGGGAVVATALAGAGFGGVVSALMASHDHNQSLERFQDAVEAGQILLLVDVPRARVDEIRALIIEHHPEADIGVAEPK